MSFLLAFAILFPISVSAGNFPPLGVIDFFGNRVTSSDQILRVLPFHVGDPVDFRKFNGQRDAAIEKIKTLPGVLGASVELVCCTEDHKSMLYVGIEEAGSPCIAFGSEPTGNSQLPAVVIRASQDVEEAWEKTALRGNSTEDDSQGHALSNDPELRALQLRLVPLADLYLADLKNALHTSSDSTQRAIAAELLGYSTDKQSVVPDLVVAMHDPASEVRNNAMRALEVFAHSSPRPPNPKISVPPQPFVEMLNSCVWTDRNKSAAAVDVLTQDRDAAVLGEISKGALPSLVEMARWKNLGHAESSLMILGRIGGLSEEQISKDIEAGNRGAILAAAQKSAANDR